MRNAGLQSIEAVVQRKQRVPAEGDDHRFLLDRQHGRSRDPRAGGEIGGGGPLLPLGDGLLVDPVAPGQRPLARLNMLYRSTDCLSRCGAPVEYLAHSASFQLTVNNAPSKPRIKHLAERDISILLDIGLTNCRREQYSRTLPITERCIARSGAFSVTLAGWRSQRLSPCWSETAL